MWSPQLLTLVASSSFLTPTLSHVIRRLESASSPPTCNTSSISLDGFPMPNPTKSFWQDPPHRIANLRSTPDLPTDETFDYVIIGSGISGAATAHKLLTRDPSLSILMLEARAAASGASGRNGGHAKTGDYKKIKEWIELYGEDEALKVAKLEQDCVDDVRDFVLSHNVSSGWRDVETADLYYTHEEFDKAVETVEFQQALEARRPKDVPQGNPRRILRGQEARDHSQWPEILGAVTYTGHTQNPYMTVCAMLELSLAQGLNLQTHTMALQLTPVSGPDDANPSTWEVKTDRGTVKGSKVVLATNGFTPALHPGFRATQFLQPGRSQVSAVRPSADTSANPVFKRSYSYGDDPTGGGYYITARQPGDAGAGAVIYGGGQVFSPSGERNVTDDTVVNDKIAHFLRSAGRVSFGRENWGESTESLGDWTGITCYTSDGLPVVGPVPGEEGLFASVCMNGHGMAWAFRSAEALVEMMEEGKPPVWFPAPFDIKRAWKGKNLA
ncbi:hypothetical protein MCOR02_007975 [Pyricularia oryzae]|nr:hypothetical protein MCOR02_007975 [Pyricularia oryzae]KAI6603365.1 hypothetical protein MCOR04_001767 [Pyricularia oryzae]